jgi:hypothetical protein
MQSGIHTAEPAIHKPSVTEVEMNIEKQKKYISLGADQIPTETVQLVRKSGTL